MERKWVICAFGDILGFGIWSRRAANTPEIRDPFIKKFYEEIDAFVKRNNFYVKYLGDGLMILHEIPISGNSDVEKFLLEIKRFTKQMNSIIKKCAWPSPEGFRTRVVIGHVDKITVTDPSDRSRNIGEYVGYSINLAQRLLEVRPNIPLICHESVLKVLNQKRFHMKFKKIAGLIDRKRGVDVEDIATLWMVGH